MNHRLYFPTRRIWRVLAACLTAVGAVLGGAACAHEAWTEAREGGYAVVFGHHGKIEPFSPAKVKAVAAVDAEGKMLAVKTAAQEGGVTFSVAGQPAMTLLHYDNGYFTQTTTGMRNAAKNEVPGALRSYQAVKYGKTILAWSVATALPQGQELEIVPLATTAPAPGKTLPLQVLWQGKPLADAKITRVDAPAQKPVQTDAQGRARFPVVAGRQLLMVGTRKTLANDPRTDAASVESILMLEIR